MQVHYRNSGVHRSLGIAVSFMLHAVIVSWVLWPSRTPQTQPAPAAAPPLQVIALSNDKQGTLLEAQDFAPNCLDGKAYRGIGMQYDPDEVVTVVPSSYPAYKAGIRLGDEILNPDFQPDADGYDLVDFKRHGKQRSLRIKTQWICLR